MNSEKSNLVNRFERLLHLVYAI